MLFVLFFHDHFPEKVVVKNSVWFWGKWSKEEWVGVLMHW